MLRDIIRPWAHTEVVRKRRRAEQKRSQDPYLAFSQASRVGSEWRAATNLIRIKVPSEPSSESVSSLGSSGIITVPSPCERQKHAPRFERGYRLPLGLAASSTPRWKRSQSLDRASLHRVDIEMLNLVAESQYDPGTDMTSASTPEFPDCRLICEA